MSLECSCVHLTHALHQRWNWALPQRSSLLVPRCEMGHETVSPRGRGGGLPLPLRTTNTTVAMFAVKVEVLHAVPDAVVQLPLRLDETLQFRCFGWGVVLREGHHGWGVVLEEEQVPVPAVALSGGKVRQGRRVARHGARSGRVIEHKVFVHNPGAVHQGLLAVVVGVGGPHEELARGQEAGRKALRRERAAPGIWEHAVRAVHREGCRAL
mmetsp:Transcript_1695/g.5341  ORF Transcript_1695/g.5341 Transcript_1695/m.5341 type:complete len:211 (+) Transcript_1695:2300-2932(+)